MKHCYEIEQTIRVVGFLDTDDAGDKFIRIEQGKEEDDLIISADELLDNLTGTVISIKSVKDIEG